jgi:hypothetical protein
MILYEDLDIFCAQNNCSIQLLKSLLMKEQIEYYNLKAFSRLKEKEIQYYIKYTLSFNDENTLCLSNQHSLNYIIININKYKSFDNFLLMIKKYKELELFI